MGMNLGSFSFIVFGKSEINLMTTLLHFQLNILSFFTSAMVSSKEYDMSPCQPHRKQQNLDKIYQLK